ncbi:tetratricopeptide repeat protein [Rivibacter subsaxonicus]|uniref:Uncharacterized protein n=1 Tax=Rivibacter subsaxonicus TaxID=457575 RepID=A0A4V2FSR6_9BURK|nr:hypothetical protein [Rivibacter subsaxonicus]RZT95285.1 hypothetical protein EV670_3036 [Rivibacter subsaxonicus]
MNADDGLLPRPPRDPRLQVYVDNGKLWSTMFALGGVGHAGSSPNPRPMTRVDLGEMAEISRRAYSPLRNEMPDLSVFPIWSRQRRLPLERGVAVPARHLWWFAEAGDTALLSDRETHHYTEIGTIDRDAGWISFADPWADEFFLQAGRNTLGIEAQGTRISRGDFERAAVGINRLDRLSLFEAYLQAFPAQADSAEFLCRLGHAVLDIPSDRLLPVAAGHFDRARRLARAAGEAEVAADAEARLFMSAMAGHAVYTAAGQQPVAEAMKALLADLQREQSPETLVARLRPTELCRLAFCVANIGRHDMAEAAASRAIEVDPAFEDGWWLRGTARFKQGRAAEALEDADRYLTLNDGSLAVARLRDQQRHHLDSIAGSQLGQEISEREQRRTMVLELAVSAAAYLKDAPRAIGYLRLLQALHPERDDVTQRLRLLGG